MGNTNNEKNNDNFSMLPIVDICFKELMRNSTLSLQGHTRLNP